MGWTHEWCVDIDCVVQPFSLLIRSYSLSAMSSRQRLMSIRVLGARSESINQLLLLPSPRTTKKEAKIQMHQIYLSSIQTQAITVQQKMKWMENFPLVSRRATH